METYKHVEDGSEFISLHDCLANSIAIDEKKISFNFVDGFWITPNHPWGNPSETTRTDHSCVDFHLNGTLEDISISVFRKNILRRTIREIWTIQRLADCVNKQIAQIEFLYQFKNYNEMLFECMLHFDRRPYFCDCQIKIPTLRAVYKWNNLCPDRLW